MHFVAGLRLKLTDLLFEHLKKKLSLDSNKTFTTWLWKEKEKKIWRVKNALSKLNETRPSKSMFVGWGQKTGAKNWMCMLLLLSWKNQQKSGWMTWARANVDLDSRRSFERLIVRLPPLNVMCVRFRCSPTAVNAVGQIIICSTTEMEANGCDHWRLTWIRTGVRRIER